MMVSSLITPGGSAAQTLDATRAAPNTASARTLAETRKAAEDFESFFLSQMMQPMFATVETDEMFGGGQAEETWRSLLVDEYGKATAKAGGVGIADAVMKVMLQAQESGSMPGLVQAGSAAAPSGSPVSSQAASVQSPVEEVIP